MKNWFKAGKIYSAGIFILIVALAAFIFINMKNSGLNTDNLAGLLGKRQKAAGSESELQIRAGKASPTPFLIPIREPTPVLSAGKETGTAGGETNESGKDDTLPNVSGEGLFDPEALEGSAGLKDSDEDISAAGMDQGEGGDTAIAVAPSGSSYAVPGVYVEEIQLNRPITGVSTDIAAFVGITETRPAGDAPLLIQSFSEYQQHYGGFLPESLGQYGYLPHAVKSFFENGGACCYIVSITPGDINDIVPDDFLNTGIVELEQLRDVSIVAVPGVVNIDIQQGFIDHCEAMKDRFVLLDLPDATPHVSDLREHRDHFDSSCAAFYHPWLQTADPQTGENRYIPPSGAIAGIYAENDRTRGVHKAPANIPVDGITGLKYALTEYEQQELYPNGINVIRYFDGRGNLVWGARTCSSYEEFKYVNVKRYMLYLNQSIRKGTEWMIYEPNDEQAWAKAVQSVDNFLNSEWRNGALMGTKPNQAYFVKMDRTTMTSNDLAQGRRVMLFGAAPVKPAEFIVSGVIHE